MQMRGSHSAFCRLTPSSAISIVIIYHQLVFLPPLVILHISTPPANFVHWDTFGGNHVSHCRYFFAWLWCLLLDKCPDLVIIMFWEERLVAAAATYLWSQDGLGVAGVHRSPSAAFQSIVTLIWTRTSCSFMTDEQDHWNQTTYLAKNSLMLQGLTDNP